MKATGIVRRIDDLGRVVVPKEIRRTMRIREGQAMEIYTGREGEIILKKYSPIEELAECAAGSVAVVGNMLKIKPILRGNEDGYIVSYKNVRGRKAVLNELIRLFCETIEDPENQIVGIAHADAYEESLYMMEEIQKRVKVREFINTSYDFCTGSHVGPDTIALFYLGKDRSLL